MSPGSRYCMYNRESLLDRFRFAFIQMGTSPTDVAIVRLRYLNIYLYEFMRFLNRLDTNESRLVSKAKEVNTLFFSQRNSRFAKLRVVFDFEIFLT